MPPNLAKEIAWKLIQHVRLSEQQVEAFDVLLADFDALNAVTGALDVERRRWYAALEKEFELKPNALEGLAPEMAAKAVRAPAIDARIEHARNAVIHEALDFVNDREVFREKLDQLIRVVQRR